MIMLKCNYGREIAIFLVPRGRPLSSISILVAGQHSVHPERNLSVTF
jgi:hypothetical protein